MCKQDLPITTGPRHLCAVCRPGQVEYATRVGLLQGIRPLQREKKWHKKLKLSLDMLMSIFLKYMYTQQMPHNLPGEMTSMGYCRKDGLLQEKLQGISNAVTSFLQ